MLLSSALEDFEGRTLSAVPGLLGKLRYLALLRSNADTYSHWGLEKVYGSGTAGQAMRTSHGALVARVLRTPLRDLADDLKQSAAGAQITDSEFLSYLQSPLGSGLPVSTLQASEKHLKLVLRTLSALVQNTPPAIPPGVSPLPPPAR